MSPKQRVAHAARCCPEAVEQKYERSCFMYFLSTRREYGRRPGRSTTLSIVLATEPRTVTRVYTGRCGRYPVFIYLSAEEARRNLLFDPPMLCDRPPRGELIDLLYHTLPLLLQSLSLPCNIIVICAALYRAEGGRLSTVPVHGVIYHGGDGSLPSTLFSFQ